MVYAYSQGKSVCLRCLRSFVVASEVRYSNTLRQVQITLLGSGEKVMKIAIYARCSTKKQSLDPQLVQLQRWALAMNHEIVYQYEEFGISGYRQSRPALTALMRAAKSKDFEAVVVVKLDRLGRSLSHLINTINELSKCGVAFISLGDSIDLSTAIGRLILHVLGSMAEFERDLIADRVKAGMERAMERGVKFGAKPRFDREEMRRLSETMNHSQLSRHFKVSRQAIAQAFAAL